MASDSGACLGQLCQFYFAKAPKLKSLTSPSTWDPLLEMLGIVPGWGNGSMPSTIANSLHDSASFEGTYPVQSNDPSSPEADQMFLRTPQGSGLPACPPDT